MKTLIKQVTNGVIGQVERSEKAASTGLVTGSDLIATAYLSGALQALNYLVRQDGGVSAHELEKATIAAGKELGFEFGPPPR